MKYQWRRDAHDARDWYVAKAGNFKLVTKLPKRVDLRQHCSPVENQGQLGSCTGNALAGCMEFLERRQYPTADLVDLSRLFIYYVEREMEGTINEDAGAVIADGIKALAKVGVCSEKTWPYSVQRFAKRPSKTAYSEAAGRKITAYARVSRTNGVNEIKKVLASGYPIVFGFEVYSGFESDTVAKTGTLNMPGKTEKSLGGHAVMMCGYDDSSQRVLVRNSWGKEWGDGGYFTMPYEYVASRKLASDFWTITY